jgi:hypothetical protein
MSESESKTGPERQSFVRPPSSTTEERKEMPITTVKYTAKDGSIKEVPLLKPEVALTLLVGRIGELLDETKRLVDIFSKAAASEVKTVQNPPLQPTTSQLEPTTGNSQSESMAPLQTPKPTEQSPRVKEILTTLEPVKHLLKIDTESSSMFVIVSPAQYLGSENFSKVASIIRSLGGEYVSAGKNSHFTVPKAPLKK